MIDSVLYCEGMNSQSASKGIIMVEGRAFLFLCDLATESECLTRHLMGLHNRTHCGP